MWTERIADAKRLDYMTFPRLFAVSEAAWTLPHRKDYGNFLRKLAKYLPLLDEMGIYYFNPFDPSSTPEPTAPDKDDVLKEG